MDESERFIPQAAERSGELLEKRIAEYRAHGLDPRNMLGDSEEW